ncbi:flagellar hook-associated protein FlgL [Comamonas endophytica]|uniref:Flagellar hook-associated protein FlgL n=1 Tax=Comamonas endophytica TaxID=2949090 RepID=A0ABY6GCX3_9BURK|nr:MULTISPECIES: flagellar hook-associated protein FlgL [unclassified Acidovorax]MCD2512716.1 flagellar hook-associated protein FlgL [Acidovorax sp. D4N7]UYG52932.1 flagellar hook-associated protein FlgL [Acidovorax sp. 5MLIR]
MNNSITRLGSANMYDRTVNNLAERQAKLANLMESTSAGKRVLRASDDPVAAAQAERARTRMDRTEADQRALDAQVSIIKEGESTLGLANNALQEFRALMVNAGNGAYTQTERDALVAQLSSLRAQIADHANAADSNGLPLFRGLGSAEQPLQGGSFLGQSGQTSSNTNGIANTLDGVAAFMNVPTGNGVLAVNRSAASTGKAWTDIGTITDPSAAAAAASANPPIGITFSVGADGSTSYSIAGGTAVPYKSGEKISVAGMSLTVTGQPADGDSFTIGASERSDLFSVLDSAIAAVRSSVNADGSTASGTLAHGVAKALAEIDSGMNRMQAVRGMAGDLLNRADTLSANLSARSVQLEADRSAAEDVDMITALSELKTQQTGYSAALQSYAQIQKLSLFDYIG